MVHEIIDTKSNRKIKVIKLRDDHVADYLYLCSRREKKKEQLMYMEKYWARLVYLQEIHEYVKDMPFDEYYILYR